MLFHDEFFKDLSFIKRAPRARVPPSVTVDELQEIISQAIWEWGVEKSFLRPDAQVMDKSVLQGIFVSMSMGGKKMDSGSNKAKDWLTPSSKEYLVKHKITNGTLKLSKTQFSEGVLRDLLIEVPWANVDSLWRRLIEEYPASSNPLDGDDDELNKEKGCPFQPKTNIKHSLRPKSAKQERPKNAFRSRGFKTKTWSNENEGFPLDKSKDTKSTEAEVCSIQKNNSSFEEEEQEDSKIHNKNQINDIKNNQKKNTKIDIDEGKDLLFGSNWKNKVKSARKKEWKNRQHRNKQSTAKLRPTSATGHVHKHQPHHHHTSGGGGGAFDSLEVSKHRNSHINFDQFVAAFSSHAKHRDNISRRAVIGSDPNAIHGVGAAASPVANRSGEETKNGNFLNESDSKDHLWMAESFKLVMDAFDRDKLLLHEAFFAFDVGGDGAVSLGEFVGVLSRMKPKLPVTKKQMFAMFSALDVNCSRSVKLLEFVTFFLTLYDKRLKHLCEDHANLEHQLNLIDEHVAINTAQAQETNQTAKINDDDGQEEKEEEEDLLKIRADLMDAKEKLGVAMRSTSYIVSSALDLLNVELAPPNEQYHGTYAAGISHFVPSTGAGGIASEYLFREEVARLGERHRTRDNDRDRKLKKFSTAAEQVAASWNVEVIIDTAKEHREEKGRRTRRINEMLAKRIFQRNKILPIKRQVLGSTYRSDGEDPMQWAVEAGKHQLKIEILDRKRLDDMNEIDLKRKQLEKMKKINIINKNIGVNSSNKNPIHTDHANHHHRQPLFDDDDESCEHFDDVKKKILKKKTNISLQHLIGDHHGHHDDKDEEDKTDIGVDNIHLNDGKESMKSSNQQPRDYYEQYGIQFDDKDNVKDGDDDEKLSIPNQHHHHHHRHQEEFKQQKHNKPHLQIDTTNANQVDSDLDLQLKKLKNTIDEEEKINLKFQRIHESDSISIDGKVLERALLENSIKASLRREEILSPLKKSGSSKINHFQQRGGHYPGNSATPSAAQLDKDLHRRHLHLLHNDKDFKDNELLPGRYAHVIRKVGLSDASVKREMVSLHVKPTSTSILPISSFKPQRQWRHQEGISETNIFSQNVHHQTSPINYEQTKREIKTTNDHEFEKQHSSEGRGEVTEDGDAIDITQSWPTIPSADIAV